MKNGKFKVKVERLNEKPYVEVLCYPKPDDAEARKRINELKRLKVNALEFQGTKKISGIPVLGKGCVGIVVTAFLDGEKRVALKIRRLDADRATMRREAEMLMKANSVDVGPKLLGYTANFLLMQYIGGKLFPEWLEETEDKNLVRKTIRDFLDQAFRLDRIGLDHGELSNASKHLIVDYNNKPYFLDFETASIERKPSNLTSLAQFLFINKLIAKKLFAKLGVIDVKTLIYALRSYKKEKTFENFKRILEVCGL